MKFNTINGKYVSVNFETSSYDYSFKSKLEFDTFNILRETYPFCYIVYEFKVPHERLFVDFFIPERLLAIECDGLQHKQYNRYFHGSYANYVAQMERDAKKQLFCDINEIRLLRITNVSSLKELL